MQFGAFKPTEHDKGPWRTAKTLAPEVGNALALLDAGGAVLARLSFAAPEDGHLVVDVEPGDGPERRFSWGYACARTDHFAGFGAQSLDVDHRGFTVPTWVEEQGVGKRDDDSYPALWFLSGTRHASQIPIPQYLSSRGYILTTETDLRSIFSLCDPAMGRDEARVEVDLPTKIHVFDGPSPKEAIARATTTFGRPRMPPRVAFAPWLDAIFGSAGVRDILLRARTAKIPSSVIWTEDWRGGEWVGDAYRLKEEWEVDRTLYPDMKSLSDDLHSEGFQFYVYFNPFVYEESKAWAEVEPNGWLVKHTDGKDYVFPGAKLTPTGLIDLDNPAAREWAVGKMRAAIALGADGWMNDFGEWLPTDGVTAIGPSLPRHNPYPVAWQEVAREAIDGAGDGESRLFFSRSGWFGTPPLADVIWAGDQRTDFETDDGMPTVLPIGIGLGLVGISTFGHDIAGYQSLSNPVGNKELFFRWTELGAWSPVMRTHHGTNPTTYEPGAKIQQWAWWIDAESTEHFRKYAALHMSLVPYLEGLAAVASATGLPIWRSLVIGYPGDSRSWETKDQVMLGDGVLVAPVMTAGATSRDVELPIGRWYPWNGGAGVAGGGKIHAAAPLGDIPIYASAGALVPTYPDGVMTLYRGSAEVPDETSVGDDRVIHAFLGASGQFTEASGLGYSLEQVASTSGDLGFVWQGQALAPCGEAASLCFEANADGAIVHVEGPGVIEVLVSGRPAAKLSATGGKTTRRLDWVVRR